MRRLLCRYERQDREEILAAFAKLNQIAGSWQTGFHDGRSLSGRPLRVPGEPRAKRPRRKLVERQGRGKATLTGAAGVGVTTIPEG